jgi:hypothetical protein
MCHVAYDPLVLSPAAALHAKEHLEDETLIRALGSYAGTSAFGVDIRADQIVRILVEVLKIKKSEKKHYFVASVGHVCDALLLPKHSPYRGQGCEREVTKWLSNLLATYDGRRAASLSQRRDDAKANLTQLVKDVMEPGERVTAVATALDLSNYRGTAADLHRIARQRQILPYTPSMPYVSYMSAAALLEGLHCQGYLPRPAHRFRTSPGGWILQMRS